MSMNKKNLLCVALVLEGGQRREAQIFEDGTYRIENGPYKKMPAAEFEMARILERRSQRTHWLMASAYEIEDIKASSEPPADYVEDLGSFTEADFLIPDGPIKVPNAEGAAADEPEQKKFRLFGKKKKVKKEKAEDKKPADIADEAETAKWETETPPPPVESAPADAEDEKPAPPEETAKKIEDTAAAPEPEAEPTKRGSKKKKDKKKKKGADKQAEGDAAQKDAEPPAEEAPQKKRTWLVWVVIVCILLAVIGWFGGNAVREQMGIGNPTPISTPEPTPEPTATPAPPARPQIYLTIDATEGAEVSGSADVNVSGVDTDEEDPDNSAPANSADTEDEEDTDNAG